jgi:hypothetical protein
MGVDDLAHHCHQLTNQSQDMSSIAISGIPNARPPCLHAQTIDIDTLKPPSRLGE